ncbi:MAG: UPF0149 family protein [Candidatus Berkiella sp.]
MNESSANWPSFNEFASVLSAANTPFSAAYVHGLMSGLLCTDTRELPLVWEAFLTEPAFSKLSADTELLNKLFVLTASHLESAPGAMLLLLPDDDAKMSLRLNALAKWCEGFLEGVTLENKGLQLDIVKEALADLAEIKEVATKTKSTKENEAAYTEVLEFVKVAVLLIYAECHPPQSAVNPLPAH